MAHNKNQNSNKYMPKLNIKPSVKSAGRKPSGEPTGRKPPALTTDLQDMQAIADATRSAAKMPSKYSDGDFPNWLAYLVAKKAGGKPVLPVPVAVPTDVQNYNSQLSALTLLLTATMRAAGMPSAQGNTNAHIYTMKDLPAWITQLKL